MMRNMSMAHLTPMPQPIWPAKVSHMVSAEWLGTLHGEKTGAGPWWGELWLFWCGEGQQGWRTYLV